MNRWGLVIGVLSVTMLGRHLEGSTAATGKIEIVAVDKETQQPLPVRMHLRDARGNAVHPPRTLYWKDHFVFDGSVELELRPGIYTFEIERGPEYHMHRGNFQIQRGAEDSHTVVMQRFVNMKQEGWWSGELHVHRPLEDIELLMRAEDLHVAPVITWWNNQNLWSERTLPQERLVSFDTNRYYHIMGGEDEREGGALMYFNGKQPLPIAGASREYPSPAKFLLMAREDPNTHIDIEKPFWWDVPVWIASQSIHTIGMAHNHMWRDGVLPNEAWGKPRDPAKYANPHGNARWSLDIYYHLLNTGIRIPPSAGSASGVLPNPVGYNRVYVYCGDEFSYERWWRGLRAGNVVVTNGPMLRPRVNGELPGHVFTAGAGETVELEIALALAVREKVEYLQVIRDGRVAQEVRLDEAVKQGGRFPKVTFRESGWMLIRAVTNNQKTYRFASTGPYWVEIGNQPRISRTSAQFFLDWVHERARRIQLEDAGQRAEVLKYHRAARDFWQAKVDAANAE
jgi:hypothetical protein